MKNKKNKKNKKDKKEQASMIEYEILSPKEDVEIKTKSALDFAFNIEKAKNIAITGNYSSGKSSTITSYINKANLDVEKIIFISLGTFKELESESKEIQKVNSETLEKHIINQIYFATRKRISKENNKFFLRLASIIWGFIISFLCLIKEEWLSVKVADFYQKVVCDRECMYIIEKIPKVIFFIIFSAIFIMIIKNIIQLSLKIKMTVQYKDMKLELENNKNDDLNLINKNIEQIIDMLKKSECKYVIFEDIDRFDACDDVFEHLKELNDILNKTEKPIKFIYIIRDEIFKGENRTKFFDYIYPVVPYVSYSTSGEVFYKLIEKYGLTKQLPRKFIMDITLFVQDMRILKNTLNEYRVYSVDINSKGIDYKNLFGIVLYKNIFSKDFADLQKNQGKLYELFERKDKIVKKLKENAYEKKPEKSEEQKLCDKIIASIIKKFRRETQSVSLYNKNWGEIQLDDKNKIFFGYINDENTEIFLNGARYLTVKEFLEEYADQDLKVEYSTFRKSLEKKETSINAERFTMSDIIKLKYIPEESFLGFEDTKSDNIRKSELVQFLLKEGYVGEDYNRYISRFHSGDRTKNDNDFIGNCKINRKQDFLYKLDKPRIVINALDENDFLSQSTLNINILKNINLLTNNIERENYRNTFFNADNLETNMAYINTELTKQELSTVYKFLGEDDECFAIINQLSNKELRKDSIKNMILYSEIEDILKQDEINILIDFIENENLFLTETEEIETVKKIISKIGIKYTNLKEGFEKNSEVFKYCVENNNYKINLDNIEYVVSLITQNTNLSKKIEMKNDYSVLRKNENTYNYIKENLNEYIENVYMLHENDNDEDSIIELLNNGKIENHRLCIVEREAQFTKYKINDISKIKDKNIYEILLHSDMIKATIDNINIFYNARIYYKENERTEEEFEISKIELIEYINRNYSLIDKKIIVDDSQYSELNKFILLERRLDDPAYKVMITVINRVIADMDITKLSEEKVNILIDYDKIQFNNKMYSYIRKIGDKVFVKFTKKERHKIFVNIDNYDFTIKERNILLKDTGIHYIYKRSIVESIVKYTDLENDNDASDIIIKYIIDKKIEIKFSIEQIYFLVRNCKLEKWRIKFINKNINILGKDEIKYLINNYLIKYNHLLIDKKQPKYKYNTDLEIFIKNLIHIGFNIRYEIEENYICIKGTKR